MNDTTHRILVGYSLDALLLDDNASERLETVAELQRQDDTAHEIARFDAMLAEEDAMIARWAVERELEAAEAGEAM